MKVKQRVHQISSCQDTIAGILEYAELHGVSATIAWLKSIRIANLLTQMREIDFRIENAMQELRALTLSVQRLISTNRGGDKGIHGFIGERAHVYISNA